MVTERKREEIKKYRQKQTDIKRESKRILYRDRQGQSDRGRYMKSDGKRKKEIKKT